MIRPDSEEYFYTAALAANGELVGLGRWRLADLSPKWLAVCAGMIHSHGEVFRASFGQMLSHIEVKLTASGGVGLGMFYANRRVCVSAAYLRGEDLAAEHEVLRMFVESLRRVDAVQRLRNNDEPFETMLGIRERPLHIVVPWPDGNVPDKDQELIRELANHFAGAFLCGGEGR